MSDEKKTEDDDLLSDFNDLFPEDEGDDDVDALLRGLSGDDTGADDLDSLLDGLEQSMGGELSDSADSHAVISPDELDLGGDIDGFDLDGIAGLDASDEFDAAELDLAGLMAAEDAADAVKAEAEAEAEAKVGLADILDEPEDILIDGEDDLDLDALDLGMLDEDEETLSSSIDTAVEEVAAADESIDDELDLMFGMAHEGGDNDLDLDAFTPVADEGEGDDLDALMAGTESEGLEAAAAVVADSGETTVADHLGVAATAGAAAAAVAMADKAALRDQEWAAARAAREASAHQPFKEEANSGTGKGFRMVVGLLLVTSLVGVGYSLWQGMQGAAQVAALNTQIEELQLQRETAGARDPRVNSLREGMVEMSTRLNDLALIIEGPMSHLGDQQGGEGLEQLNKRLVSLERAITAVENQQLRTIQQAKAATKAPVATPAAPSAKVVTTQPSAVADTATRSGPWVIVLASISSEQGAKKTLAELRSKGVEAESQAVTVKGKTWTRLVIKGFASREAAKKHADALPKLPDINDAWVTQ